LKNDINAFNPVEIDETVTLENIIDNVKQEQFLTALVVRYFYMILVAVSEDERARSD